MEKNGTADDPRAADSCKKKKKLQIHFALPMVATKKHEPQSTQSTPRMIEGMFKIKIIK